MSDVQQWCASFHQLHLSPQTQKQLFNCTSPRRRRNSCSFHSESGWQQGYLTQKKQPPPVAPPCDTRNNPTRGSSERVLLMSEVPLYTTLAVHDRAMCLVALNATQSSLGAVDPSVRALSGRLKSTARRHKFNKYSLCTHTEAGRVRAAGADRGLARPLQPGGPHPTPHSYEIAV